MSMLKTYMQPYVIIVFLNTTKNGLVAELIRNNDSINTVRDSMDYMDWYCSGIGADNFEGYVAESCVTSEIANDLLNLGWIIKPYPEDEILKQI